jgi:hypothetical protein
MKKFLFLTVALLALNLTFTSCSKDDDNAPDSLTGTAWSLTVDDYSTILSFISATECTFTYSDDDEVDNATYVYEKPKVTITDPDEGSIVGTVNGNKITFTREVDGVGVSVSFTRK